MFNKNRIECLCTNVIEFERICGYNEYILNKRCKEVLISDLYSYI